MSSLHDSHQFLYKYIAYHYSLQNTLYSLDIYVDNDDVLVGIFHAHVPSKHNIQERYFTPQNTTEHTRPTQTRITSELDEYFLGRVQVFKSPYRYIYGTPFQHAVWNYLSSLPYTHFTSYKHITAHITNTKAYRATGAAVGSNPLGILIPCHRVLPHASLLHTQSHTTTRSALETRLSPEQVGNYHGGSSLKYLLLQHEQTYSAVYT